MQYEVCIKLFADDEKKALELFKRVNKEENEDKCLDYEEEARINDIDAAKIIIEIAGIENTIQIQNFEKEKRNKLIKQIKNKGLSIRQIERLTGISFGVIRNI